LVNPIVLLLGGESLVGKDFQARFEDAKVKAHLTLTAAGDGVSAVIAASTSDDDDEPEVIQALDGDQIASAKVIVLSGSTEEARAAFTLIQKNQGRAAVVDLTGELATQPESRVRAPFFETKPPERSVVHSIPHPAAYLLAHFLTQLHQSQPVRRAVATIFEPASMSGLRAINELQRQAIGLFTFKPLPKEVFGEQVAFNLIVRPGEESTIGWSGREKRIERDLASLLAIDGAVPMPSLRLVQAPVFHGYAVSLWVEFATSVKLATLLDNLKEEGADLRTEDLDPPNNVNMAGQSGYAVGAVEVDHNDSRACWFWLAADNHQLAAELAMDVVRELL
jgi:aspartate-semialdehyde dehydrogenase